MSSPRLPFFPLPSLLRILRIHLLFCALAAAIFSLASPAIAAPPNPEVEALLKFVGELKHETFIRNGDPHTAKEAEAHLRMKWINAGSRVVTAEDFIRYCATKSSLSCRDYLVRYPDGHDEPAALVLTRELHRLRSRTAVNH